MNRRKFTVLVSALGALAEAASNSRAAAQAKGVTSPGKLGQGPIPYLLKDGKITTLCDLSKTAARPIYSPEPIVTPDQDGYVADSPTTSNKPANSSDAKTMSYLSLRPLYLHPNQAEFRSRTKDAASFTLTFAQRQSNDEKVKPQQWTQVLALVPSGNRRDIQEQSIVGVSGLFDKIPVGPYGGSISMELKSSAFIHQSYVTYQNIASKIKTLMPEAGASGIGQVAPALAIAKASLDAASSALNLFDAVFEALAADSILDMHIRNVPRNVAVQRQDGDHLLDDPFTLQLNKGETTLLFVAGPDPTISEHVGSNADAQFYGSDIPNLDDGPRISDARSSNGKTASEPQIINNDLFKSLIANDFSFALDADGRLLSDSPETNLKLRYVTYVTMTAVVFFDKPETIPTNFPPVTVTPTPTPTAAHTKAPSTTTHASSASPSVRGHTPVP